MYASMMKNNCLTDCTTDVAFYPFTAQNLSMLVSSKRQTNWAFIGLLPILHQRDLIKIHTFFNIRFRNTTVDNTAGALFV